MLCAARMRVVGVFWLTVSIESGFFLAALLHHCPNEKQKKKQDAYSGNTAARQKQFCDRPHG